MRTQLLLMSLLAIGGVSNAIGQTIVPTTPQPKNVLLEEYTGTNCQFCPDGHKIAQEMYDANPGRVVLSNIHVGVFAGNNPNYKTQWGTAIDSQADVSGYPAGSINRRTNLSGITYQASGSAMSRGSWSAAASQVLAETTPVNLAIDASVNMSTSEMTLLVEVYYTSATSGNDNLNIAMLQNNVVGPQIDGGNFYPEMFNADGTYNHQHMFRELLTGQWGVTIPASAANSFWDTTIVYTIPASYSGIATNLEDMEVAAFITDGTENVYTATSQYLYPENLMWDMDLQATSSSTDNCATSTDIQVEITNNGTVAITDFDMSYAINGGTSSSISYAGNIAPGSTDMLNISGVSLTAGNNTISFTKPENVNSGTLINPTPGGILAAPAAINQLVLSANENLPFSEDFETGVIGDSPANMYSVNEGGYPMYIVDNQVSSAVTWNIGAYENSDQSYRFRLYSFPTGYETGLITDGYDLTSLSQYAALTFDYAFASLDATDATELAIEISTDCGNTWTEVWAKAGTDLATAPADGQNVFYPLSADWTTDTVDISAYKGETSVNVRAKVTVDFGNCLYLDNLNIIGWSTGVEETTDLSGVTLYPNPAKDVASIELNLQNSSVVEVTVFDMVGKVVAQVAPVEVNAGTQTLTLNTSELNNGLYHVNISTANGVVTEKLVIKK